MGLVIFISDTNDFTGCRFNRDVSCLCATNSFAKRTNLHMYIRDLDMSGTLALLPNAMTEASELYMIDHYKKAFLLFNDCFVTTLVDTVILLQIARHMKTSALYILEF